MANRFGTRRVFSSAIGIFTFGSVLCGISRDIHWLVAFRILQGAGGGHDAARRAPDHGAHIAKSEACAGDELRRHSRAHRSDAGPDLRRIDHRLLSLERHFLRQRAHRTRRFVFGCTAICRTTVDKATPPLDIIGLILFSSGIALLSYVLEVSANTP